MKFRYITLFSLLICLGFAEIARADSDCWLEQKLIGTSATGFYRPYGQANLMISLTPDGPVKRVSCSAVLAYGICTNEHSFIPSWEKNKNFLKIKMTDGSFAYLKEFQREGQYSGILVVDRTGTLFPANSPIFATASTNSKSPTRDKNHIETFLNSEFSEKRRRFEDLLATHEIGTTYQSHDIVKNKQGSWVAVDEKIYRFTGNGPEKKESAIIRSGYFHHRNPDNSIIAVLEDEWCD